MSSDTDHEFFMQQALALAVLAGKNDEVPVGCVVVIGDQVVGRGANAPLQTHDPSAHAEVIAIRDAGQALNNYRLSGATLYVTLEPCMMCAGAIVHARIGTVVFGASDPKSGVLGGAVDVSMSAASNHRFEVVGGVCQDESADLLRTFFRQKRLKGNV
ncbi:MAG: tRNA adenosine(34) deaminase TadA [Woeseiaceae bacterium]